MAMTRAMTRIKAIYQTFTNNAAGKYAYDMDYPSLAGSVMEWQATIGSKKVPETPITSIAEYYHQMIMAAGNHVSVLATHAISLAGYTTDSFIVGVNLERVLSDDPGGNTSGISTRQGDLLSFRTKNTAATIDTCWTVLAFDMITQIGESGVEVFD